MNLKNNKGITLVALIITIIIMLIIAGITLYNGTGILKEAEVEDVKTNMLLIQAQVKTYVEQAKFEGKDTIDQVEVNGVQLSISESTADGYYQINNMADLNLADLDNSVYLISFDIDNITADVYYVPGITDSDGNTYYRLSEME